MTKPMRGSNKSGSTNIATKLESTNFSYGFKLYGIMDWFMV